MLSLLPHTRIKCLFPQPDGLRGDLDQLVVADVFEGVFEGELAGRGEREGVVGAGGADVG